MVTSEQAHGTCRVIVTLLHLKCVTIEAGVSNHARQTRLRVVHAITLVGAEYLAHGRIKFKNLISSSPGTRKTRRLCSN